MYGLQKLLIKWFKKYKRQFIWIRRTKEEVNKELAGILEKFPLVEKMLVPINELAEKKDKVRTAGNIYNKYYSDLKAAALAYLDKEV